MTKGFPDKFLFGGAIAANQAEGAYQEGLKGLGICDILPVGKDRLLTIDPQLKKITIILPTRQSIFIIMLKKTLLC